MSIETRVNDYTIFFPSAINYTHTSTFASKNGSVLWKDCNLLLSPSTTAGSVACIQGYLPCYLNQEEAVTVTLNAAFAPPTEDVVQKLGMGDSESGVFVGYDGLKFGLCLSRGGSKQYHLLELNSACTTNGSITLIILGNSYSFNVTQGMSPLQILYTIAQSPLLTNDNLRVFAGSERLAIYTYESMDCSATDSLTSIDFGSSGVTGTLTIAVPGVQPDTEWIYATDFQEVSKYLPTQLDLTTFNVYRFTFSRWSNAPITFSMLDPLSNHFGPLCSMQLGWKGFNTSKPYNPHVSITNYASQLTSIFPLQTNMATITSGTPSSNTNITYFSTQFVAESVSVPVTGNYVIGVFNVPLILNNTRNYQTCSISGVDISISTDRDVVCKIIAGAGLTNIVPASQHLPWSSMKHGMPTVPTYAVQGLDVMTLNVSAKECAASARPQQIWLAPGTTAVVTLTAAAAGNPNPLVVSCNALISWNES